MIDGKIQIIKDDEINLRAFFQVLWSDRKLILKITGCITFLGLLYALLATPLYKSTITMYPSGESSSQLSQLQGMASMLGMNMGGGSQHFIYLISLIHVHCKLKLFTKNGILIHLAHRLT